MRLINWLNGIHLEYIRQRVVVSGVILFLILILDIHRFGAWYTGNQCHMKPYGFSLLCLATSPLVFYAAAKYIQFLISRKLYIILYMTRIYLFCLFFSAAYSTLLILNIDAPWYDKNIFRPYDLKFLAGVGIMLFSPLIPVVCLVIIGYIYKYALLVVSGVHFKRPISVKFLDK